MNGIFTKIDPSNPEYRFRTYYDYNQSPKINTDAIKNFFGIHSPSKVMQDEVGKFLAEGIGVGAGMKEAKTNSNSSRIDGLLQSIGNQSI